jgi:hypothetical protein
LRVIALVGKAKGSKPSQVISAEDLQDAEALWLLAMQRNLPFESSYKSWENSSGCIRTKKGYFDVSVREEFRRQIFKRRRVIQFY